MPPEPNRLEPWPAGEASDSYCCAALDALPLHVAVVTEDGTIEAVNAAWRAFARENTPGQTDQGLGVGGNYLQVCQQARGPEAAQAREAVAGIRAVLDAQQDEFTLEYPCHSPEQQRWFSMHVTPFPGLTPRRVVVAHANITERKLAEQRLRETEQRYALTIQGSQNAIFDWDLCADRIYYSPAWGELLGGDEQWQSQSPQAWFGRIVSQQLAAFQRALVQHIEGQSEALDHELQLQHADGSTVWVLCRAVAVRDEQGRALRLAGSLADVSELKRTQQRLQWMALHDPLTGLPNRKFFAQRLEQALERRQQNAEHRFAVLMIDSDRFKLVNDTLGHEVGDALLCQVAERLRKGLSRADMVARFGGDEFAVLLDGVTGHDEARQIADRLVSVLGEPYELEGHELVATASIGMVDSELGHASVDELLRDADAAMYQAKNEGRDGFRFFDATLQAEVHSRINLERQLWQVDYDQQFRLVFQPIVSLETGALTGFETLLRWDHPTYGMVPPDRFITIAEESGAIVPLGQWVLRRACEQLAAWRRGCPQARDVHLTVNLSRRQLVEVDFVQSVHEALSRVDLPPEAITLEVTETAVVDEPEAVTDKLRQLRELGVSLALDDFGTGHSSLSCLHQFPIDILKIDRSFVWNMDRKREFTAVLNAVVTLARNLRMGVVAEGVENAEQVAQLQAMDASYAQGYYFAPPLDAGEAERVMRGERLLPSCMLEARARAEADPDIAGRLVG